MTDEELLFPAGPSVPGQAESRRAYHQLLAQLGEYPWWQDYRELVQRGWTWREAVVIAWRSSPIKGRVPATQEELATQVLGLTSDRVIAKWFKQKPEMEEEITRMQASPLFRSRRDIFDALAASASDPDPKCHPDRKLALEMLGDYKPRQTTQLEGGNTPVVVDTTLTHVVDAETAGTIFDILATAGVFPTALAFTEDDEIHPPPADG
jgi:hypothetical protein